MALCCPASTSDVLVSQGEAPGTEHQHAPINFLYGHLHDSIRTELQNLSTWALQLEASSEQDLVHRLLHLKERYHFLEQVYKYHSSVEDEVVYPALDTKVKNVTSAYSVEHQDEEYLFEHLASLLASALAQDGAERAATVRKLICKIEEIHTTLRKHLAKEEAQLLPLLLQHFSHAEQAELVAQFLYCIPLDTVERVLSWLKPMVPQEELQALMGHLRDVIPDRLLLQLLVTWLNPAPGVSSSSNAAAVGAAAAAGGAAQQQQQQRLVICPFAAPSKQQAVLAAGSGSSSVQVAAAGCSQAEQWPPLRGIVLFHHSIRGALEVFAAEAAALQQQAGVSAGQLAGLVERHRFLRSVCMFHTLSEEEVMFPEVLRISGLAASPQLASVAAACATCQAEHGSEVLLFEELGRLLADVRAFVRRGRTRDVSGMLGQLVGTARKVCAAISTHMQREEAEVLPLLAAALSPEQQRGMRLNGRFQFLWGIYRAHSKAEDEIVFPALESKEALHNVSHAYTLDHEQEEQLFHDLAAVISRVKASASAAEARELVLQLRRMCAAVRASLETHVRAEEAELWPLFSEHFSVKEQQHLVGVIIGRTGAEVLQALLPWVTGSFSEEEKEAMMGSLREATKNTMFDQWLGAVQQSGAAAAAAAGSASASAATAEAQQAPAAAAAGAGAGAEQQQQQQMAMSDLAEIAEYLTGSSGSAQQQQQLSLGLLPSLPPPQQQQQQCQTEVSGTVAESTNYVPGWEDIFNINQKQLEAAIRRVHTCRLCHDDASDHRLDRYAVSEMCCMLCGTRQPVAGSCSSCGGSMAGYYCSICHLFDDEPGRDIYHCPFCNVCRRGKGLGVDFFHCMQCNACMSLSLFNSHTCRERAMEGNCPVCHEYLFDSATPIKELPCGHFLHSSCFAEYARYAYTCPICCKSIGDMSVYFQMLDSLLASERRSLPAELASKSQTVLCQDCGRVGDVAYHFVYHKCPACSSYNTRVM
ncbi:hypothetical protein OEZ85_005220 [Tetradesmus obliquus]|uniref:RING-type domain-containing protein n=1 Tax=Tetradesmus obliquus TaxID=3088 RepID=A0ABY8UKG8_TETOB|nr:hypothetical protein OEZ85_005220 [Tetradesmus obliquus]